MIAAGAGLALVRRSGRVRCARRPTGPTMFEVVPTHDRPSWLAARRLGVGASDIAGVVGVSPWTTPFQVWADKVADLGGDIEETEAMRWGSLLESVILDEWESDPVNPRGLARGPLVRNVERPWMMATPDGLGGSCVVEVKNSSDWRWDEIPAHYACQVQWQLAVTGFETAYLVVLFGGRRLETFTIEADPTTQAELVAAGEEFWKLVETNEAPPVEADDNTTLSHLWPRSTDQAVDIGPDAAVELYEAKQSRDAGKSRYEAATASIKAILQDADTAVVGQQVVATWREANGTRYFRVKGDDLSE